MYEINEYKNVCILLSNSWTYLNFSEKITTTTTKALWMCCVIVDALKALFAFFYLSYSLIKCYSIIFFIPFRWSKVFSNEYFIWITIYHFVAFQLKRKFNLVLEFQYFISMIHGPMDGCTRFQLSFFFLWK